MARTLIDRSLTFSKSYSWRDQMGKSQTGNGSVDVLQAMNIVDSKGGDGGVPWVGGQNAGGRDQPPILVVSDVVKAGYNIEQGHDPTSNDQGQADTRVAQVWKTPAEAVDYARAVLGDVKIETKNNADREVQPGHGLGPKIEQDRQDGIAALSKLVNGNAAPSPDELAKVSAPGTQLNRDVVETIRRLQPQERAVVVGKLAAERATAANVERAMMLRRLLHPLPGAARLRLRRRTRNPAHGGGHRPGGRPNSCYVSQIRLPKYFRQGIPSILVYPNHLHAQGSGVLRV